MKQIALFMFN